MYFCTVNVNCRVVMHNYLYPLAAGFKAYCTMSIRIYGGFRHAKSVQPVSQSTVYVYYIAGICVDRLCMTVPT